MYCIGNKFFIGEVGIYGVVDKKFMIAKWDSQFANPERAVAVIADWALHTQ